MFACFPTAVAAAFCYLSERIKAGAGVSKWNEPADGSPPSI